MSPTSPNPTPTGKAAPTSNGNGNVAPTPDRYIQLAALWNVEITDPSIQLLQECDRQFAEMRATNERQIGEMKSTIADLKAETKGLKEENGQWRTLTAELLGMNRQQVSELKTLNGHIVTLATNSNNLGTSLKSFGNSTNLSEKSLNAIQNSISTSLSNGLNGVQSKVSSILERIGSKNDWRGANTVFGTMSEISTNLDSEIKASKKETEASRDSLIQWAVIVFGSLLLIGGWQTWQTWRVNDNVNTGLIQLNRLEQR